MSTGQNDEGMVDSSTTPAVPSDRAYTIVFAGELRGAEALPRLALIDKEDFAGLLGRVRPTLPVSIKAPDGTSADWESQLSIDSFKSFEPASLLAQFPQGRWRLGLRDKILARLRGDISQQDLDTALRGATGGDTSLAWISQVRADASAPAPGATPPEGTSVLDWLENAGESDRVAADVERIAASAGSADAKIDANEKQRLAAILQRLDKELTSAANALLKHPDLRALEGAWRGLKFLVDRAEIRAGVRIAVISAARAELLERLVEHVFTPAFDGEIATPGMVVLDATFTNSAADITLLDEIAQQAASLPAPVVFSFDAQFFNVKSLSLLKNLPNFAGLLDGWQFAKWKSLRDKPYARMLAPVLGRFVLRAPYEPRPKTTEFIPAESIAGEKDLLWGGGHLAMAFCAARAFARHGWPTRMFGMEAGRLEDLPVVTNPADPQNPWGPGDFLLPDRRLDELPAVGLNVLMSVKGQDACVLLGGVSAARPIKTAETSERQAALEISFPYQQFSNITSSYLCELMPTLRGVAPEQIQRRLLYGLRDLMQLKEDDPEDAVMIGVGPQPDDPSRTVVQVRITPPGSVVPGGLHIDFNFSVGS